MKKFGGWQFISGFVLGALFFGGSLAVAATITATPSSNEILVDGQYFHAQAYMINGRNYVQLRDIARAADFSVVWDGEHNQVLIDTRHSNDAPELRQTAIPQGMAQTAPFPGRTTPKNIAQQDRALWQNSNYLLYETEIELMRLVNETRRQLSLQQLSINSDLCKIARIKAREMLRDDYFAHESPNYGTPMNMLESFGVDCTGVGENLTALWGVYADDALYNWMNSPSHKEAILNNNYTQIGVGLALDRNGQAYWSLLMIY